MKKKLILFYGDSITDMGRARDNPNPVYVFGHGYVNLVVSELMLKYHNQYNFINQGIGGNKVLDLLNRLDSDCLKYKPDYISILIGVNDVWHGISDPSQIVSEDEFKNSYKKMLDKIFKKLPNVKVMLLEPFFLKGAGTKDNFSQFKKVFKFAKIVKELSKEYGLIFVPLQKEFDKEEKKCSNNSFLLYDGVHPNMGGAELIAKNYIKGFNKLIKK